jgi:hypothetical protein
VKVWGTRNGNIFCVRACYYCLSLHSIHHCGWCQLKRASLRSCFPCSLLSAWPSFWISACKVATRLLPAPQCFVFCSWSKGLISYFADTVILIAHLCAMAMTMAVGGEGDGLYLWSLLLCHIRIQFNVSDLCWRTTPSLQYWTSFRTTCVYLTELTCKYEGVLTTTCQVRATVWLFTYIANSRYSKVTVLLLSFSNHSTFFRSWPRPYFLV